MTDRAGGFPSCISSVLVFGGHALTSAGGWAGHTALATPCHCSLPLCKPTQCPSCQASTGKPKVLLPWALPARALWAWTRALLPPCCLRPPLSAAFFMQGQGTSEHWWQHPWEALFAGGWWCFCGQLTTALLPCGSAMALPPLVQAAAWPPLCLLPSRPACTARCHLGLLPHLHGQCCLSNTHGGWQHLFVYWRSFAVECEERDTTSGYHTWGSAKAGGSWGGGGGSVQNNIHHLPWVFLSTGDWQPPWWKEERAVEVQDALVFWYVLWASCYPSWNCILPKCLNVKGSALGKWVPGLGRAQHFSAIAHHHCHSSQGLTLTPAGSIVRRVAWCFLWGVPIYMFDSSLLQSRLGNFPCFWGLGLVFPSGLFRVACES